MMSLHTSAGVEGAAVAVTSSRKRRALFCNSCGQRCGLMLALEVHLKRHVLSPATNISSNSPRLSLSTDPSTSPGSSSDCVSPPQLKTGDIRRQAASGIKLAMDSSCSLSPRRPPLLSAAQGHAQSNQLTCTSTPLTPAPTSPCNSQLLLQELPQLHQRQLQMPSQHHQQPSFPLPNSASESQPDIDNQILYNKSGHSMNIKLESTSNSTSHIINGTKSAAVDAAKYNTMSTNLNADPYTSDVSPPSTHSMPYLSDNQISILNYSSGHVNVSQHQPMLAVANVKSSVKSEPIDATLPLASASQSTLNQKSILSSSNANQNQNIQSYVNQTPTLPVATILAPNALNNSVSLAQNISSSSSIGFLPSGLNGQTQPTYQHKSRGELSLNSHVRGAPIISKNELVVWSTFSENINSPLRYQGTDDSANEANLPNLSYTPVSTKFIPMSSITPSNSKSTTIQPTLSCSPANLAGVEPHMLLNGSASLFPKLALPHSKSGLHQVEASSPQKWILNGAMMTHPSKTHSDLTHASSSGVDVSTIHTQGSSTSASPEGDKWIVNGVLDIPGGGSGSLERAGSELSFGSGSFDSELDHLPGGEKTQTVDGALSKEALRQDLVYYKKRFHCPDCDYKTNINGNLKRHLLTHTDERPFGCAFCDLTFRSRECLKRHFNTAHPDKKPLACKLCDYRCVQQPELRQHTLAVHYPEKVNKLKPCDYCDYKTDCRGNLKRHTLLIHGVYLKPAGE